jgi:Domain of unknown function (DUF1704)
VKRAGRARSEIREGRDGDGGPSLPVPDWAGEATRALAAAISQVRLISANTPTNLRTELDRLVPRWRSGQPEPPRFLYAPSPCHGRLRRALDALGERLDPEGELGALYAARARELSDEAVACERAGGPDLWEAARRRYAPRDLHDAEADALAVEWVRDGDARDGGGDQGGASEEEAAKETVRSDDERHPGSLVSRMRQEIGRRRLALRVLVTRDLASLAATGDGFVQVIAGCPLTPCAVERTVLHELDGHVAPHLAAALSPVGIFSVGTARGSDDQEGRALHLERAAGFLDLGRRRELALRHLAARAVERRADFVATVRLLSCRGASIEDALRIAARAHRGGGLAREAVYLPALLRVEAALARDPGLDRVLACGRIAVDAALLLGPWARLVPVGLPARG